ncbi:putative uncharacterized domain protein [Pseudarthrobacter siccitolerans]|uniref:Uncharacterized domain protein n=1 Tax=Pseudarthrobacter siccitolerans TaxID=861266 RepID=A0A024H701_9MICC|nr:putative uncharacterized domain protein [Pseudarthrobacter siccitolerans]
MFWSDLSERGQKFLAGRFAAAAGLGADPAVIVHSGVPFALVTTCFAGSTTGLQNGAGEVGVIAGMPGQDVAGCYADVGAVEVGADALGQVSDHVFAQARVGARGAGLRALEAGLDALGELFLVYAAKILRIGIEHGHYMMGHWFLLLQGTANPMVRR